MEKLYISPEFEVLKIKFVEDVILASTEPSIPIESSSADVTDPSMPTMPDF